MRYGNVDDVLTDVVVDVVLDVVLDVEVLVDVVVDDVSTVSPVSVPETLVGTVVTPASDAVGVEVGVLEVSGASGVAVRRRPLPVRYTTGRRGWEAGA